MLDKSLKVFYFILIIFFFYFVLFNYFSQNNISTIKNKMLEIKEKSETYSFDLPVIKNDTDNIIFYNSEEYIEKKIKKRKIWELLK